MKSSQIDRRLISPVQSCFIIAEAGVNHNGSEKLARQLIDAAVDSGADAVKFQSFRASSTISKFAPKALYQLKNTSESESQYDMIKKLELDTKAHISLFNYCNEKCIEFLSTPFDFDSVNLLANQLKIKRLKVASSEITNGPLLLKMASTNRPILLSTGMSTLGEIEDALAVLSYGYVSPAAPPNLENFKRTYWSVLGQKKLSQMVTLLHCTTEYPAMFNDVNLLAIDTLKLAFGLPVGFSDHTPGYIASLAAVSRGAVVVEKHLTLDKALPGPDHKASLEPAEFKELVYSIRQIQKMFGNGVKIPAECEQQNIPIARKSLVALKAISKGNRLTQDDLTFKRPGTGISPMKYWELIGSAAIQDFDIDDLIQI